MHSESWEDEFSMREWLHSVKAGFGEKFAHCFRLIGCEDKDDLTIIGAQEWRDLQSKLSQAGAKRMHFKRIKDAIETLGGKITTERFPISHFHSCHTSTHEMKSLSSFQKGKTNSERSPPCMYLRLRLHCQNHQFCFTMKRSKPYRSAVDCMHCH